MPRNVIPLVTGETYHVYNRGVDKRDVFMDKADYIRFYQSLLYFNAEAEQSNFRLAKANYKKDLTKLVEIKAYSLLPNHYHLMIEQLVDGGISEFMKRVSAGYTGYFNNKYERSGSLFQGNFKRVHVPEDDYYNYLFVYVNENHFVHLLPRASDIIYSSSSHHAGKATSQLITSRYPDYSSKEAQHLAKQIAEDRITRKKTLE